MKRHKPTMTRKQLVDAVAPYYDGKRKDLWEMADWRIKKLYKDAILQSFLKIMTEKLN
jgi:hypothetical protein